MNRFDIMALGAAIFVTLLLAQDIMNAFYWVLEFIQPSGTMWTIMAAGWVIATYGPIALAASFWRWGKRARAPWALHVLLLPWAVILFRVGESLMAFVIGGYDPFDHTLGGPVVTGALLFVIAMVGYSTALIWSVFRRQAIKRRSLHHS